MEVIFKYITKNLSAAVLISIGIVAPGILTIAAFDIGLFERMDIIKLLVFGCSISITPACILYIVTILFSFCGKDNVNLAISMALSFNCGFFAIGLILKMLFKMHIQYFILLELFQAIIYAVCCIWDKKRGGSIY
ncbi:MULTISPECIES: hypothetical protein [unclassified Lactonifactor]|uniref:hypothetical protein n=1 Tax=Lactonifactor TaxID=420345 RepID=UPI0012B12FE8|nr:MULTISPECIES: hypothetical protein [unclassified Lactonifactor]MSA03564.1 hypothetical protein [Lactonifactor sp. BIOML-A5]MSA07236.1 hypothetical protein [Lactonifactor sp. BIOML-A4]MSA14516.1 hypothetical protein [Lactonifactor sp. BIOML-A3]MSA18919.1 hypothetical protein [Lactonifactor sp. BIOML-A2]MSA37217.1 hypothetical protein [Lactonifactor sp. BIOML-A1]